MSTVPPRTVPALSAIPPEVVTLADHEALAERSMDANAWAYFHGGAGDEITVRLNRQSWDDLLLLPRVLRDLTGGHTRLELLGRTLAHPILLAPAAFQKLAHPDGEIATAYAAAVQGAGLVLSTQSSTQLEDVAAAVLGESSRGPLWFQLYWQRDRDLTVDLIRRVEAAGYEALVLTVDAPTSGARDRERRAQFRLPPNVASVNLVRSQAVAPVSLRPDQSAMFDGLLASAPTWDSIAWLRSVTKLPVIVKGILHADDARMAVEAGVSAIIVSNHGGRTLDTAPPTARVLSGVVETVDGAVPVLVDGGIRRGTDVVKAIALGATAVLIGRPYVYGLANAGAMGVAHIIRLLRDELEIAMALCGCKTLAAIDRTVLMKG